MGDSETKILDALTELKTQLQNARGIMAQTDLAEEIWHEEDMERSQDKIQDKSREKNDVYTVNITPDELSALLSIGSAEMATDFTAPEPSTDELAEIKKAFLKFREQTDSEINNLRQSITVLSEMWGHHEMEIRKAANNKS